MRPPWLQLLRRGYNGQLHFAKRTCKCPGARGAGGQTSYGCYRGPGIWVVLARRTRAPPEVCLSSYRFCGEFVFSDSVKRRCSDRGRTVWPVSYISKNELGEDSLATSMPAVAAAPGGMRVWPSRHISQNDLGRLLARFEVRRAQARIILRQRLHWRRCSD
jgi:hypothetical protein